LEKAIVIVVVEFFIHEERQNGELLLIGMGRECLVPIALGKIRHNPSTVFP